MVVSATGRCDEEGGFAAIDALVALMILATTIALCLRAVETARKAAVAANETRYATQLLRDLLDASPRKLGTLMGHTPDFAWRLDMSPAFTALELPGGTLCERSAKLVNIDSGRAYSLATTEACPKAPPS